MSDPAVEVSVVIPCLNEADTVASCVRKAVQCLREHAINGEVIVADNGSSDESRELAEEQGARIVCVAAKGYGAALMGGIDASFGKYVLMGDADDSYDFRESFKFIDALRSGAELAQGCRFPSGGGTIKPGAMPFMHRWLGNPLLSWLVRRMFSIPIRDVYCGMRGFRRDLYDRLDLRSPGMEFATEMVIKAGILKARISEVPITLHPDGRTAHGPHLRTFHDGWRTLRLFLVFSPKWTFLVPGCILLLVGLLGYIVALPQASIAGIAFDVHTLLVASLSMILGWQCILLAALARIYAGREGLLPLNEPLEKVTVERGIIWGLSSTALGVLLIFVVVIMWWSTGFGRLNYPTTMRWVVPGVTLVAIGYQTMISALFAGVLKMGASRLSATNR